MPLVGCALGPWVFSQEHGLQGRNFCLRNDFFISLDK